MTEKEFIDVSDLRRVQAALGHVCEIIPGSSIIPLDELIKVKKILSGWSDKLYRKAIKISDGKRRGQRKKV